MIGESGRRRALALAPGLVIVCIVVADSQVGQSGLTGLLVIAPMLAASLYGPRVTAGYGLAALVVGILLGIPNDDYAAGDPRRAQLFRLLVIAAMSPVAVLLSRDRLARERRLSQVTKVAEAAQRAILLPVPERLGAVRVAVHYESAVSDALIGGDMYGMVQTPYGLRILVGDVRGKGLEAVRMSAQVLAAFRERANDDPDLGVLLDHMDRAVARASDLDEDFVTAVLLQLDDDGVATVVNAGHPAPFVLTQGRVRQVEPPDPHPPLGLGVAPVRPVSIRLAPHDRLLLYTDGLTEARDPRTRAFFSPQTIIGAVASDRDVPDALASLRDDVLQWTGGGLHDDIALVLVEYRPGNGVANSAQAELVTVANKANPGG